MKAVNQPIRKKDAMALVTGKPVFMDDLVPKDCLIVKLLRSPHANAIIKEINKTAAEKVPGIEAIYTWEDVPQQRFTTAGQTYPSPLCRMWKRNSSTLCTETWWDPGNPGERRSGTDVSRKKLLRDGDKEVIIRQKDTLIVLYAVGVFFL